ncbi:MAG: hypothetical protein KDA24_05120 [Deltaproteobacteria bacterium]|nr:hypothetical protein [Deltaproteobacteria bacterium]
MTHRIALLISCLLPALAGCEGSGLLGEGNIEDVDDLRAACDEGEPEDIELEVVFEAANSGCPFGEKDNLPAAQGLVTARQESRRSLPIPEGGVVCGLDFDFTGLDPSFEQIMEYDDHFMLNFNGVVLAANYGPMVEVFEDDNGLRIYDWDALAGYDFAFDNSIPEYCLGEEEGLSDCTIPPPETPGPIALSFQGSLVDQLALRALEREAYEFALVTTGDNDGSDCSHAEFTFKVTAPVLIQ